MALDSGLVIVQRLTFVLHWMLVYSIIFGVDWLAALAVPFFNLLFSWSVKLDGTLNLSVTACLCMVTVYNSEY
jgi:hypothetical protein